MRKFTSEYDIHHLTSSPHHSNANGMAESAVKTASRMIRKCKDSQSDFQMAMLIHRNTPSEGMLTSPAQRLLGRRTRANLPITKDLLKPYGMKSEKFKTEEKQRKSAEYYNQGAKELKPLTEGQSVRMKPFALGDRVWKKGQISKRLDERSYEVQVGDGNLVRRNRGHLKPTSEPVTLQVNKDNDKPPDKPPIIPKPMLPDQEERKPKEAKTPIAKPKEMPSKPPRYTTRMSREKPMKPETPKKNPDVIAKQTPKDKLTKKLTSKDDSLIKTLGPEQTEHSTTCASRIHMNCIIYINIYRNIQMRTQQFVRCHPDSNS